MFSWDNCGLYQTPTVNKTSKHATGSFYLKGKKTKPLPKDLCSPGCKTQAQIFLLTDSAATSVEGLA